MGLLGHQGAQDRDELGRGYVLQPDDLGDILVAGLPGALVAHRHRRRTGILVLDHAHYAARAHGGVAVHLEDREKQVVQLASGDRLAGDHLYLPLDCRVHHDGGAGRLGDELDQFLDVGLFQVYRVLLSPGQTAPHPQGEQGCLQGDSGEPE